MSKKFLLSLFLAFSFWLSTFTSVSALSYGSGTYTNICGTGLSATSDSCNRGCSTSAGSCSARVPGVVRYVCSGKQVECRSSESNFATYQSLGQVSCGQTVQIDVFNKTCRSSNGAWICGDNDLQDYLVWYSGDCRTNPVNSSSTNTTNNPNPPANNANNNTTPVVNPPSTPEHRSSCDSLKVVGGNNSLVPAKITLRASGSDNKGSIQRYRYYFGDSKQEETDQVEIQHTYESSGTFYARVDVKDSQGNWKTSSACESSVYVKASSVESHKSSCSNIFISVNHQAVAPARAEFKITGYDNKGDIKQYRLEFGDGASEEKSDPNFAHDYPKAGTYPLKAYIKDSEGNWQGGSSSCARPLYIHSAQPITRQPATGTPMILNLIGLTSGLIGFSLRYKLSHA